MSYRRHPARGVPSRVGVGVVALTAALGWMGCEPTFEPEGSLRISGQEFRATSCHVLTCPGGIELLDAAGARLVLTMSHDPLQAFRDVSGIAKVRYEPPGGAEPADIGSCASLRLTGEGYHGAGRRAASGRVSLQCTADVEAQGTLSFEGCF